MAAKTSVNCGDLLDISQVASLCARLQKALQTSSLIEIKADNVQRADTAGLQLLVALAREVEQGGGKLMIKKPSAALQDAARLLGLNALLNLS